MSKTSASVIVVSNGRAELLQLCLTGIGQLYYPNFEIIVVADPAGVAAVQGMGLHKRIKIVPFEEMNISAARNAGIAVAAGDVVAFIDDDAVPEPSWLTHLLEPFEDKRISAAGGFVRGRNGISYQWMANLMDRTGKNIPLDILDTSYFAPNPPKGGAVKTEGTNCAFRRKELLKLGGFDPVYRFFHDESDLNMRIASAGLKTALVPLAQVHHGYAPSDRRAADRAPTSLHEIGASTMVFLRKYIEADEIASSVAQFEADQHARLIRHMVSGGLEPRDIEGLMDDLRAGLKDGEKRGLDTLSPLKSATIPYLPYIRENATNEALSLAGRWGNHKGLAYRAEQKVNEGNVVTIYHLSPTALYHHVRFTKQGFWEQTGGIFGRSHRQEPLFQNTRFRQRATRERQRVASVRQNQENIPHIG